jgi:hypothetical protein
MQLDDFVATSLKELIAGIKRAQAEVAAHGGVINPQVDSAPSGRMHRPTWTVLQDLEFDIAVTVSENEKTGAGLKVAVPWINAGIDGGSGREQSAVSRIKFRVPVALPVQLEKTDSNKPV